LLIVFVFVAVQVVVVSLLANMYGVDVFGR
jgi:hypothetical protein